MIQRNLANIVPACKQQRSVSLGGLALGVIAGIPQVSGHTLTLEGSDLVCTALRAGASLFALVDVLAGPVIDQFVAVD